MNSHVLFANNQVSTRFEVLVERRKTPILGHWKLFTTLFPVGTALVSLQYLRHIDDVTTRNIVKGKDSPYKFPPMAGFNSSGYLSTLSNLQLSISLLFLSSQRQHPEPVLPGMTLLTETLFLDYFLLPLTIASERLALRGKDTDTLDDEWAAVKEIFVKERCTVLVKSMSVILIHDFVYYLVTTSVPRTVIRQMRGSFFYRAMQAGILDMSLHAVATSLTQPLKVIRVLIGTGKSEGYVATVLNVVKVHGLRGLWVGWSNSNLAMAVIQAERVITALTFDLAVYFCSKIATPETNNRNAPNE